MARVLLIDDERTILEILAAFLSEHGHVVGTAASGEEGLEVASDQQPDVVVLDVCLPGMSGIETFTALRQRLPGAAGIFMTAHGTIRSAVDAMRAGGDDYLTKPFDNDELLIAIDRVMEVRRLAREVEELRTELTSRYGFDDIVGISSGMRDVFRFISRVANRDATVLVLGESGTGKEMVARAIHRRSGRAAGPFLAVNCSAIPPTLVESEFFGFEKGAFTDAKEAHAGKFEQAHGGTLFLDEVGDLPLDAQGKLLRVLEDREVTRIGARKPVKVDVRVLAATNRDLDGAVAREAFRQDLFWRLNVLSVKLPPLRDRPEDLPLLIDAFVQRLSRDLSLDVRSISPEARRLLTAHDWPGNVRELENTLQRAMLLAEGTSLQAGDLPPRIRGEMPGEPSGSAQVGRLTLVEAVRRSTERIERTWIQSALAEHHGNRTAAAEALGINRKTLFNKLREYGMAPADEVEPQ
jgi:DNA-binding NtrC family response regulator